MDGRWRCRNQALLVLLWPVLWLQRYARPVRWVVLLLIVGASAWAVSAWAQVPAAAHRYRAELTRTAHAVWGLDAPVPAFAAQIHQESGWHPEAVSRVGARGMAQFMPSTARWWCDLNGLSAEACQPSNPTWAMRALVGYDRWLHDRLAQAGTEPDRMWATLRAYNGGLGHWRNEARNAASPARQDVDAACGTARRHASHCPENLGYPRRILVTLQPRYSGWGRTLEVTP